MSSSGFSTNVNTNTNVKRINVRIGGAYAGGEGAVAMVLGGDGVAVADGPNGVAIAKPGCAFATGPGGRVYTPEDAPAEIIASVAPFKFAIPPTPSTTTPSKASSSQSPSASQTPPLASSAVQTQLSQNEVCLDKLEQRDSLRNKPEVVSASQPTLASLVSSFLQPVCPNRVGSATSANVRVIPEEHRISAVPAVTSVGRNAQRDTLKRLLASLGSSASVCMTGFEPDANDLGGLVVKLNGDADIFDPTPVCAWETRGWRRGSTMFKSTVDHMEVDALYTMRGGPQARVPDGWSRFELLPGAKRLVARGVVLVKVEGATTGLQGYYAPDAVLDDATGERPAAL